MNEKNSEQWNNGINNEEISSAKSLDNQNLSKEIKMEDDVRNRDNTIISSAAAENCREFRLGKTQAANLTPSPPTTQGLFETLGSMVIFDEN